MTSTLELGKLKYLKKIWSCLLVYIWFMSCSLTWICSVCQSTRTLHAQCKKIVQILNESVHFFGYRKPVTAWCVGPYSGEQARWVYFCYPTYRSAIMGTICLPTYMLWYDLDPHARRQHSMI